MKKALAICFAAILGSGAIHLSFAAAGTNCSFGSSTVTITISGGTPTTIVRSGDAIDVNASPCGAATVTNTDNVVAIVSDTSLPPITIDLRGGPFAPGLTDEGDGSSEIEFLITPQAAGIPLTVIGSSGNDTIHVGVESIEPDLQVNLNGAESVHDPDVTVSEVCCSPPAVTLEGRAGNDVLLMAGDPGVASQYPVAGGTESGGPGDDSPGCLVGDGAVDGGKGRDTLDCSWLPSSSSTLIALERKGIPGYEVVTGGLLSGQSSLSNVENIVGGAGSDQIFGNPGDNSLSGGGGDDLIGGSAGDDVLDGGSNGAAGDIVTFNFVDVARGVTVDLSAGMAEGAGADTLIDFEGVDGTKFADTLIGRGTANSLDGLDGNDTLYGRAGPDQLHGGVGDDSLDGGAGFDACRGGVGTDTIAHCES